jgi:hypothetical protein
MPDGTPRDEYYIDSSSPTIPRYTFSPTNIRDILQRQIQLTVDRSLDSYAKLSIGKFDGRYLNQFPGTEASMRDNAGSYYFVVGKSIVGDPSVAAP